MSEQVTNISQQGPVAYPATFGRKTCVDHDGALPVPHDPEEIIHLDRAIALVVHREVEVDVASRRGARAVLHDRNLILVIRPAHSSTLHPKCSGLPYGRPRPGPYASTVAMAPAGPGAAG